jgi:thymidylate synthase (FAD)
MKIELYDDSVGFVELVQHMGSDLTIVNSARVSFGKHKSELDDKDKKLIKYLVKHRHTSTFEHNAVTFRICVPLFVRSQHHRHRTWSYNEISRRYTDVDINFYQPSSFRTQHDTNRQASNLDSFDPIINPKNIKGGTSASYLVRDHHRKSLSLYNELLENGVCREQARGVLPQNMYTEYYATVNLNNLLKFIDLRTHEGAQWEIQKLALAMLDIARTLWPHAVESYVDTRRGK